MHAVARFPRRTLVRSRRRRSGTNTSTAPIFQELHTMRRLFRNVALLLTLLGAGTVVSFANGADPKVESDAKKADADAMDLWLGADFKGAKTKLEGALKKCGDDKCGPAVLAALHRDLGIVQIALKDTKNGLKSF